jgi:hypothetical protein
MQHDLFGEDIQENKTVSIPFKTYWKSKLLAGLKTCTTRTAKYGKPGDTFSIFGGEFEIIDVVRVKLSTVKSDFYNKEGCLTPLVFEAAWCSVHPAAQFKPDLKVYLHFFRRIK